MKGKLLKFIRSHFLIVLFLIFYFGITAYKFAAFPTPFYDWDESIYAQVGKEMVQRGSIVPLWQGQYWLDKPPLVPLTYGIIETLFPMQPELSTRLFTLLLTILLFSLIYRFYFKITKNVYISFLTVVASAFTTIFLQRSQVLNVDIFLFLGWMGYAVFYSHFWRGFFFLAVGVLSKSLLGFYPAIIIGLMYFYQFISKKITLHAFRKNILKLIIQIGILSVWYIGMLAYFKYPFIQAHFLDSHLKRVTASIESHFGKRTFYIDLLLEQLAIYAYLAVFGFLLFITKIIRKKNITDLIMAAFFVPWFLFLNLTKTKIHWYLYPVIPQFAFLGLYILQPLRHKKILSFIVATGVAGSILYAGLSRGEFFKTQYSTYDEQYRLATYAKNNCKELTILVDKDSRTTHDTLKNMDLLINTSEWWGNHPAIVYYSNQKVNFEYDVEKFQKNLVMQKEGRCIAINNSDTRLINIPANPMKKYKDISLYKL